LTLRIAIALCLVVALMVAGQMLFKASALAMNGEGTILSWKVAARLVPALAMHALATLAWVWLLQFIDLGRAYPFTAMAYVLVPLVSMWVFGEVQGWRYYVGVILICTGVIVTATSPASEAGPRVVRTGS
jgi:drug/metabolite transporter (DMT)-like permease